MENTKIMNAYGMAIVDNRWMGKVQLTADDLGGNSTTWAQYRQLCDNVVISAWDNMHKKLDDNVLGTSIAALFAFFGTDAKATQDYKMRVLASVIARKPQRSQALKDAMKAKKAAKEAWENAIDAGKDQDEISALGDTYDEKCAVVDDLMAEPKNYWFDLVPMIDKTKKHATPAGRKAIEDCIADIINQRALMTAEQLQAEAQRLADERKGRELRKKKEAKTAEAKDETKSA